MLAFAPLLLLPPLPPQPRGTLAMAVITVCEGGACGENGADLLLAATAALGSGMDVRTAACSSECPSKGVAVCPDKGIEDVYITSTDTHAVEDAVAAATALIRAAGGAVDPSLPAAFAARVAATKAQAAGDDALALIELSTVLSLLPAALLEPSQAALEP